MDSTDLLRRRRRVRTAYELRRLGMALVGIAPFALVVAIAASVAHRPASTLFFGLTTAVVAAIMLWYGRTPQKAVLPGIIAGLVPLTLALCASYMHACGPNGCTTLCVPACSLGGVVAGLIVAQTGKRRHQGKLFWLSASGLALMTGAMGCSCVGYSGVIGLAFGIVGGLLPGLLRSAASSRK